MGNLKDNLIIFDDLERISPSYNLSDLLGFINSELIENNHYKILFVANEEEIKDERYLTIKEKIISNTFVFLSNTNEVFSEYISKLDKDKSWFYEQNKELIIEYFNSYEVFNLRTVFYIFRIFNFLLQHLEKKAILDNLESIILFVISISNEYKLGLLTTEDLNDKKGLNELNEILFNLRLLNRSKMNSDNDDKKETNYVEIFSKKYLRKNRIKKFLFYDSIFTLIINGYVLPSSLKNEIKISSETVDNSVDASQIMFNFREYDEKIVIESIEKVLELATMGTFPPIAYGNYFHWLKYFADNNILKITSQKLENQLKKGLSKALTNNDINTIETNYSFKNIPENPLTIQVNKALKRKKEKEFKKRENEFINNLENYKKIESSYKDVLSLDKINIVNLAGKLKKVSAKAIFNFTSLLVEKYGYSNVKDHHKNELEYFKKFNILLKKNKVSSIKAPLKKLALKELSKEIDKIINKLK